jgi:pimeloyl-ACP methyl ester carboxylesterase
VAPILRAQGHDVVTPDLPCHGNDRTPAWRTTLEGYARAIHEAAVGMKAPPIVVGHSMGGFAMTEAASRYPGAFAGLIYVCAFVPNPGETLLGIALADRQSTLPSAMARGLLVTRFRKERARDCFYATSPEGRAAAAAERLLPEPMRPALKGISRPRGPMPPRAYIECLADKAITIGHQRMMHRRAGITQVSSMDTDHSPFFADPATLARQIMAHATAVATAGTPTPPPHRGSA